ncbi:protein GRINL1A [Silurus asotus]|uniref:Protein GRINL1A n=1 Tax=Silurus asotus TaxID=30991 RepID=A0AAD5B2T3_SILAS|nr:protein GRINL1A [Silurus asotus]
MVRNLTQRFIQTLPDKGKKIFEFAEKVRRALAHKEEEEKKHANLAFVRTELQARYQQAFTQRRHVVSTDTGLKDTEDSMNTEPSHTVETTIRENGEISSWTSLHGDTLASGNADGAEDTDLAAMFGRVTLSEENAVPSGDSIGNPVLGLQPQKKPHYLEVLERSGEKATKPRFRPNQLPLKSASPSPGQSTGSVTPISAEARRQRDRKHLDDITAAKLPPLHHSPAQLLSLEESVILFKEQATKHQELQAKMAAQKLAEGLSVSLNSYNPEGGALAAYREVHDDDGTLSEED